MGFTRTLPDQLPHPLEQHDPRPAWPEGHGVGPPNPAPPLPLDQVDDRPYAPAVLEIDPAHGDAGVVVPLAADAWLGRRPDPRGEGDGELVGAVVVAPRGVDLAERARPIGLEDQLAGRRRASESAGSPRPTWTGRAA